jgi:hypothetical protein
VRLVVRLAKENGTGLDAARRLDGFAGRYPYRSARQAAGGDRTGRLPGDTGGGLPHLTGVEYVIDGGTVPVA